MAVTGAGTDTITINPTHLPKDGSQVYIEIAPTAFTDGTDYFPGINDKNTWSFTMQHIPVITGISEDAGISGEDGVTNDNTLTIFGTSSTGASVIVSLDGTVLDTVDANGNNWSLDYTSTTIADGVYSLTARAIDTLGNISDPSDPYEITIDTEVPMIHISAPSDTLVNSSSEPISYTVSYTGTDSITLTAIDIILNTTGNANGHVMVNGTGNTRTVTISDITGDGTLGIGIVDGTATDLAGNYVMSSSGSAFNVDNTAPSGHDISIDQNSINIENQNNISFSFANAELNTAFTYTFSSDNGGIDVTGHGLISVANEQITNIDLSGLGDGTVTLRVVLTDGLGNESAATIDTISKDTVFPQVTSITGPNTNPIPAGTSTIAYTVLFNENVSGIDTADFELLSSGPIADITAVSVIDSSSVTITISNISGPGTLQLRLNDDDSILDKAGNPLGGTALDNGNAEGAIITVNAMPGVLLSDTIIAENDAHGNLVGYLSANDLDIEDNHTYNLVAGNGDTDNDSFTINENQLLTTAPLDFETKNSYSIRVQVTDGIDSSANVFMLLVTDIGEPDMEINVPSLTFPTTAVHESDTLTFEISNTGDTALVVNSITYPSGFSGDFTTGTIDLGNNQVVTATFSPTLAQVYSGDIIIVSNSGQAIISLSGEGEVVTAIEPTHLSSKITLHPNPTDKEIHINLNGQKFKSATIYNATGYIQKLNNRTLDEEKEIVSFDVGHLPEGIHFLCITTEKGETVLKFMTQRK